ncbi:MAG: exodeoxyribonuclease VII small subunit [Bdellovibrionaceae bacterium]|nr:exodeoxyribonuclease VII small subunit [Pseudobdellovibrionaceae bacterium]
MSFEKKLEDLEKVVSKMEEGKLSLEDSLKQFEKGVKLSRECQDQLSKAEIKVQKLVAVNEQGQAKIEDL